MLRWFDKNLLSVSHIKNRMKLVSSFRKRNPEVTGRPNIIYVESTNWCNLKCPMCPTTIMQRETVNMDYEVFTRTIDQVDTSTAELIVMHSDGEPLMNKRFFDMVEYAKKKGLRTYTSTNATALNESNARRLIDSGFDVLTISMDGTTKEIYESIRIGAKYEKVMKNVHRFLEMKGPGNPTVIMQMIEMPETEHQSADFMEYWSQYRHLGVIPVIKGLIEWFEDIPDIIDNYNWCDRPWFGLVVHSNGNVSPCVHDYDARYPLGNVMNNNIYDMWNGEEMVALRKSILKGRRTNNLCQDCNYAPPIGHNFYVDAALAVFDMCTVSKLIPRIGFNRARQYISKKNKSDDRKAA